MNTQDTPRKETDREDLAIEVFRVWNALKHPDSSEQMKESKEVIFQKVSTKIEAETEQRARGQRRRLFRALPYAAAVTLLLSSIATLTYFGGYRSGQKQTADTEIRIEVPFGTLSQLTLPDGTLVTLNGGSQLTYPAAFGSTREVKLRGEGFFEVAKDAERPFIVHTQHLSAHVLGTCFGFKAYQEDAKTVLTLAEGKVSAQLPAGEPGERILLKPNQQLIIDNHTGSSLRRNVDAREYTGWKDGILTFRNLTLQEIAVVLQRRFNVSIRFASEQIKDERYVAQFKYQENIEQILDMLSYKRAWKYKKKGGCIELTD